MPRARVACTRNRPQSTHACMLQQQAGQAGWHANVAVVVPAGGAGRVLSSQAARGAPLPAAEHCAQQPSKCPSLGSSQNGGSRQPTCSRALPAAAAGWWWCWCCCCHCPLSAFAAAFALSASVSLRSCFCRSKQRLGTPPSCTAPAHLQEQLAVTGQAARITLCYSERGLNCGPCGPSQRATV